MTTTDVIVLAAGMGRRLGLGDRPKWLVPVGSTTPAALHLEACRRVARVRAVLVVAGFASDAVRAAVAGTGAEVVLNPRFADRNNWYSLLLGLDRWLAGDGEAIWVLNSDLCAPVEWFASALDDAPVVDAALVVDRQRPLSDEAMKVSVSGDRVAQIGKVGVEDPVGEYVGLTWLRRASAVELRAHLASIDADLAAHDSWYEHGIQRHADAGGAYHLIDVPDGRWVEIDEPDEVALAAAMIG